MVKGGGGVDEWDFFSLQDIFFMSTTSAGFFWGSIASPLFNFFWGGGVGWIFYCYDFYLHSPESDLIFFYLSLRCFGNQVSDTFIIVAITQLMGLH